MFKTLRDIFHDNWEWRNQIWHLALTEMQKEVRGSVLGWLWLILTPAIYVGVLWLALVVGLRTASPVEGIPYVVWLTAGVLPWQFCSGMLTGGSNVYRRYPYLVNRLRFPLSVISSFYTLARLIVFLMTLAIIIVMMIITHVPFTIYLVQLPFVILLMYCFWLVWSLLTSPLAALSKDFHTLIKALSAPLFWLSGVFFNIDDVHHHWQQVMFAINPITFFVTGLRACFCENFWIWERTQLVYPFVIVFAIMTILALFAQNRLNWEIADVL